MQNEWKKEDGMEFRRHWQLSETQRMEKETIQKVKGWDIHLQSFTNRGLLGHLLCIYYHLLSLGSLEHSIHTIIMLSMLIVGF